MLWTTDERGKRAMTSQIRGFIALCTCSSLSGGGHELGCRANGCISTCPTGSNTYWGVYPHYKKGCFGNGASTASCTTQTGLPAAGGCGAILVVSDNCASTSSQGIGGEVLSCGPNSATRLSTPFHGCSPASGPLVASINAAWADRVFGTNPFLYGHVYARVTITSEYA